MQPQHSWFFIACIRNNMNTIFLYVHWGCWIHRLHLCRGVRPHPNEFPGYDTKNSNGEVPIMLELWGMRSISLLPSLPDPIWPGVVEPDRVRSSGQTELNCVLMLKWIAWNRTVLIFKQRTYAKLNCLKWNCSCMLNWFVWNRTVYLYKMDLALNNLQRLICHKIYTNSLWPCGELIRAMIELLNFLGSYDPVIHENRAFLRSQGHQPLLKLNDFKLFSTLFNCNSCFKLRYSSCQQ